jgi:hypothetical protein
MPDVGLRPLPAYRVIWFMGVNLKASSCIPDPYRTTALPVSFDRIL